MKNNFFLLYALIITGVFCGNVYAQHPYKDHETTKLHNFLSQESAEPGVKNYQQLGLSQINDVKWSDVPGLSWNNLSSLLERINWSNKKLAGNLDISGFEALRIVSCDFNELTSLDVTDCTSITNLDCFENNLNTLDVSTNVNMTRLCFRYNNLKEVDLSNNRKLTFLCSTGNQLSTLDLSGLDKLETLYCVGNQLVDLNIKDCVRLKEVLCMDNRLTNLDLSDKTYLREFSCARNNISDIKIENCSSLTTFDCSNNELTTIDFSGCGDLLYIKCIGNLLERIKIEDCISLEELYCYNNQIDSLKMPDSRSLKTVHCKNNNMDFYTLPQISSAKVDYIYYPQNIRYIEANISYVDLSAYYEMEGSLSRYVWYDYLTVLRPESVENGIFRFDESLENKQLICNISNTSLSKLVLRYDVTVKSDEVGNNVNPEKNAHSVYASEGYIHAVAASATEVKIFSLKGVLLVAKNVEEGRTDIAVERGIYVVTVNNGKGYMLAVR